MRVVYLYSSAKKRTITRSFVFSKATSLARRNKETKEVAAFHAFGIPGTPHVVLAFQSSQRSATVPEILQ